MKKNLVLLGMMAVGKTTLGKMVAKNHDLEFIDTDAVIENKYSMSVNDIFEKKGEKFFRNEEKKEVLKQLKKNNNKLFSQQRYRLTYEPIIYLYGGNNKLNFTADTFGETQTDVWEIATPQSNFKEGKYHSAQKPLELYRRIIKTSCNKNDLVLDCFAGSGTTGVVCKEFNINCILIEKDKENINIIKGRL